MVSDASISQPGNLFASCFRTVLQNCDVREQHGNNGKQYRSKTIENLYNQLLTGFSHIKINLIGFLLVLNKNSLQLYTSIGGTCFDNQQSADFSPANLWDIYKQT